jgi:hypothetical protein
MRNRFLNRIVTEDWTNNTKNTPPLLMIYPLINDIKHSLLNTGIRSDLVTLWHWGTPHSTKLYDLYVKSGRCSSVK